VKDYEYDFHGERSEILSPQPNELDKYQAYMRDELPRLVEQELELEYDAELQPVEERLRRRFVDIVRSAHQRVFQSYQRARQPQPQARYEDAWQTDGETSANLQSGENGFEQAFLSSQIQLDEIFDPLGDVFDGLSPQSPDDFLLPNLEARPFSDHSSSGNPWYLLELPGTFLTNQNRHA